MKRVFFAACVTALLVGCGGGDSTDSSTTAAKATDKYIGTWSVRYSGADTGTCSLAVKEGTNSVYAPFSGTCKSVSGVSVAVSGTVDSLGIITSSSPAFSLMGSLFTSTGSGTWDVGGIFGAVGNWSATRA